MPRPPPASRTNSASEPLTRDTSSWVELPEYGALFAEIRDGRPYLSVKLLD